MSKRPRPREVEAGDVLVVEAPSAEEALEAVTERLGPDARIVSAERVRRGGVAGFFAREMIQLTAARSADAAGLARLGARAALDAARRASSFAEHLEAELEEREAEGAPRAPQDRVAPPGPEGREAGEAAWPLKVGPGPGAGLGPVAWSLDELVRIGLPYELIEAVARLAPRDDLSWVGAIAGRVARYCAPMPDGPSLVIGPRADRLARALDLPLVRCPEVPRNEGTVCVVADEGCADLAWLARAQAGRWVHAVLGGPGSDRLREWSPKVVSWIDPGAVADALRWCAHDGAILGYGVIGTRLAWANPVDVALGVRELVVRG